MTIIEAREMLVATRKERGITQKQMASTVKVTQSWISEFETRDGVGWSALIAYAKALGIELSIERREVSEGL